MHRSGLFLILLAVAAVSCARGTRERTSQLAADTASAAAIARDRSQTLVRPWAGQGTFTLERVAVARESLGAASHEVAIAPATGGFEPPSAAPNEPPPATIEPVPLDARVLQPPIPRGAPSTVSAGRGGHVTLDVRVDEAGDVSDAFVVESDADSVTVTAAVDAALAMRYHPALLGGRPVAVWTRQVVEVRKAGARR